MRSTSISCRAATNTFSHLLSLGQPAYGRADPARSAGLFGIPLRRRSKVPVYGGGFERPERERQLMGTFGPLSTSLRSCICWRCCAIYTSRQEIRLNPLSWSMRKVMRSQGEAAHLPDYPGQSGEQKAAGDLKASRNDRRSVSPVMQNGEDKSAAVEAFG